MLTEIETSLYYLPISSFLSKKFKIEKTRAEIIEEQLEANGILSAPNMSENRKVRD